MNTFQGYLEKLGGNFSVAAFIPSLAFVTLSIVAFGPIVPEGVLVKIQFLLSPFGQFSVAVLLVAVIIGFTLTSLNTQIYKLFEGYVFFKDLSYFRSKEIQRSRKYQDAREKLNQDIALLEKRLDLRKKAGLPDYSAQEVEKINLRIQNLKAQRDAISAEFDQYYPPYENLILPTRLGNILRSAETYPRTRWGADSVPLWPRIIYSVSKAEKGESFLSKVDFSNDQCSFLLNASLLSGILAVLSLLASAYQALLFYLKSQKVDELLYFIPIELLPRIYFQRITIYLAFSLVALGVAWFFYNSSLFNVSQYGNLIRSTFDLFRFDLLKDMHLELPSDTRDEEFLWRKLCEMIAIGRENSDLQFEYSHSNKPEV